MGNESRLFAGYVFLPKMFQVVVDKKKGIKGKECFDKRNESQKFQYDKKNQKNSNVNTL